MFVGQSFVSELLPGLYKFDNLTFGFAVFTTLLPHIGFPTDQALTNPIFCMLCVCQAASAQKGPKTAAQKRAEAAMAAQARTNELNAKQKEAKLELAKKKEEA